MKILNVSLSEGKHVKYQAGPPPLPLRRGPGNLPGAPAPGEGGEGAQPAPRLPLPGRFSSIEMSGK